MWTATIVEEKNHVKGTGLAFLDGATSASAVRALSDEFSRRILASVTAEGKTVRQISVEQAVPTSTCYRRAHELVKEGLLVVERIVVTGDGKRYAVYRSSFKRIEVSSDFVSLSAFGEVNDGMSEKLHNRNLQRLYAQRTMGAN